MMIIILKKNAANETKNNMHTQDLLAFLDDFVGLSDEEQDEILFNMTADQRETLRYLLALHHGPVLLNNGELDDDSDEYD